jgi:large subunit ribosomal protein L17
LQSRREARKILVGHSSSSPKPLKALAGKTELEKMIILQERCLINGEDLVTHLFDVVAPRFRDRNGGYTRLTKTGLRRGDAAVTAVLELVD